MHQLDYSFYGDEVHLELTVLSAEGMCGRDDYFHNQFLLQSDPQSISVSLGVHFDAAINTNAVRPGETPE